MNIIIIIIIVVSMGFLISNGYSIYLYIHRHKQIKKSNKTLNCFLKKVQGNMDKESLINILSQFDKEFVDKSESEIQFKCYNAHVSQYVLLRNIIIHRIELIEMVEEYEKEKYNINI